MGLLAREGVYFTFTTLSLSSFSISTPDVFFGLLFLRVFLQCIAQFVLCYNHRLCGLSSYGFGGLSKRD